MKEYYSIFNDLSIFVIYGTIFFTVLSGFHYIYIGTKLLNEKR